MTGLMIDDLTVSLDWRLTHAQLNEWIIKDFILVIILDDNCACIRHVSDIIVFSCNHSIHFHVRILFLTSLAL